MPNLFKCVNVLSFCKGCEILIAGAIWAVCCNAAQAINSQPTPNVLIIVVDDLGYGELGCYGGTEIPTPHIDSLASSGVTFTSGYVTAPYCAASRAGLLTGKYQTRFGFEFNPIGAVNCQPGIGLPSQQTIASRLRDHGYATALIGKWHLGGTPEFHPQRRGFDEFFGFLHEGHYFVPQPWLRTTTWLRRTALPNRQSGRWISADKKIVWSNHMGHVEPPYDADNPILRSSQPTQENENLTTAFTREASDFIRRNRQQPFFLLLAYNAVHSPLQADDRYLAKFAHIDDIHRRIFAAMLSHLDDGVGQVLQTLQEQGIDKNTLVILLSDNGGATKELTSSNHPLRGGKGNLYEGGIRVPMIAAWPGKLKPASISTPAISMDIAATVVDFASQTDRQSQAPIADISGSVRAEKSLDGISWLKLLQMPTEKPPERDLYWRMGNRRAIRSHNWKAICNDGRIWELYDLATDLSESNNLSDQHPEVLTRLITSWDQWNAQQVEPLWK